MLHYTTAYPITDFLLFRLLNLFYDSANDLPAAALISFVEVEYILCLGQFVVLFDDCFAYYFWWH